MSCTSDKLVRTSVMNCDSALRSGVVPRYSIGADTCCMYLYA